MKFIILFHYRIDEPHFDLMIESGNSLATWRIPEIKLEPLLHGETIDIVSISPHDKKFLNFEGELSPGKGSVKIYDRGIVSSVRNEGSGSEYLIFGTDISGKLIFNKIDEVRFSLRFIRILSSFSKNENIS